MTLIYPVVLAVAFAIGAVAGYVKYRFLEPDTIYCLPGSTDERCMRLRKVVKSVAATEPNQSTAPLASESR